MNRLQVIALAALVLTAQIGFAQTSKGSIAGAVTDASGAAVPGATVTAKDSLGGENRSVTTGPNGEYRIEAINPSTYTVTVTATGFNTKKTDRLEVVGSSVTSLNIQLEIGNVATTVEVQAAALTIQTDSAELSKSISTAEVRELPLNSLNPIELVLTEPGAVTVNNFRDGFTNGVGFAVNGLRPRANNFLLDGFDNNDNAITGQALQPSNPEAVREVSVMTNSYAAEFGRGGASVTNVIFKGGTNQWHGAGWDRYGASALNAITAEQHRNGTTVVPQFVENVYGFALGGPLVKNKLFIFGSSQWDHFNGDEQGNQLTIPTQNGLNSLLSIGPNASVDIIKNSLLGFVSSNPTGTINIGNRPGCGSPCLIEIGTAIRSPKAISRSYEYDIRGDYVAGEKDTFSARYIGTAGSLTPDLFANGSALPGVDTFQGGPARNLGAFWTHVYNPRMVNEVRFTAQTIDFTFGPLASTAANPFANGPAIAIGQLGASFGGFGTGFPQGRGHNVYQYQEAFSWNAGNHSFKMGVDLAHLGVKDSIPFNSRGTLSFVRGGDCSSIGLTTCSALANFIDNFTGPVGSAGKQFGNPLVNFAQTQQAYYFQDTWKLRPNFTMNYGVRYEYQGTPLNSLQFPTVRLATALNDPILTAVQQKPDKNNFGPRLGIAYTPHFMRGLFGEDKTVFRAGGGVFYDGLFTNIQDNVASSAPNALGGTLTSPSTGRGSANALSLVPAVTASLNPRSAISTIASDIVQPMTYQWNFNMERQLPGDMLATIAYVGTRGERLFLNDQLNPGVNGVRLNPARGSISARANVGDSIYHGLQIDVNRRFRNGLLLRGAYTWSHAIDNGSEVFVNSGGSSFTQNLFNRAQDRGNSAFDRRQRAVFTWIYQIPFRKSNSGFGEVLGYIAHGWEIAGTAQFQTGAPETVFINGFDQNGDLSATNDRPDLANPRAAINLSPACLGSTTCITGIGQVQNDGTILDLNTNAPGTFNQFRYLITTGHNGSVGRNTLFNPGRQDYTLAVTRSFHIPHLESHSLEFRAEAFNPFNHANAGGGNNIGGISGDITDPNFLNKDITIEGGRVMRLWLKYRF